MTRSYVSIFSLSPWVLSMTRSDVSIFSLSPCMFSMTRTWTHYLSILS